MPTRTRERNLRRNSREMIRVGIIGAAGYTAGELMRILLNHPEAEIAFALSGSHPGEPVWKVHEDLLGETPLCFTDQPDYSVDVLFLCSGHGRSRTFMEGVRDKFGGAVIDLSNDFRLDADKEDFQYGLPEAFRSEIASNPARHIANPGCFATSIQLALLPMASRIEGEVHVTGITGSTGAGQNPSATTHFSWRSSNLSIYKPFTHQHLGEVGETLSKLGYGGKINFVPVRGDFPRGILSSVYFSCPLDEDTVKGIYEDYYKDEPFVRISPFNPDLKMAVGTNRCILYVKKYGDKVHVISLIDNLIKGASGQAVQNMNIIFGLDERTGLVFKAQRF